MSERLPDPETFAEVLSAWFAERVSQLEAETRRMEAEAQELGRTLTGLWRELTLRRRQLRHLQALAQDERERLRSECLSLASVPGIVRVTLTPTALTLHTGPIVATHEGRRYRLGRFRVEIGAEGWLRVENTDNPGKYPLYDHPHIRDGQPCLGNLAESVPKLLAEQQFTVIAHLIMSFLGTYNPADAYCEIHHWPEVQDEQG